MEKVVFAQISDAHIGQQLMENTFYRRWDPRSGYNPHDARLLEPLEVALDDACALAGLPDDGPLPIVFGGDLTAGGTDGDYATGFALLFERWQRRGGPFPRFMGLGWDRDQVVMVPGNHDHWRSRYFQGAYSAKLSPFYFDRTPWRHDLESENARVRLELYGVDSNAGLLGVPLNWSPGAGGKLYDDDLIQLAELLRKSDAESLPDDTARVRAFVCHHAFSRATKALPLDDESRKLLQYFAGTYQIPVAMTGHNHQFPPYPPTWVDRNNRLLAELQPAFDRLGWQDHSAYNPRWLLFELRSSTALAGPAGPGLQGFFIHRLGLEGDPEELVWRTWKYQTGAKDFDVEDEEGEVIFSTLP